MDENKKAIVFTVWVVLAILLAGGGFWLGLHHGSSSKQFPNDGASSLADSGSSLSPSAAGASLNVSNASATSLGQLNAALQTGASGSPQASSSGQAASSSSSPIDPSTFSQYDKYKNNSTALFGEVRVGSGASLGVNQKATIAYKGWLTNGTMFDQSSSFGFTLGAHQVIPGMEEGVSGMKVGGTRLIIIPPDLGYGAQGQGSIPGDAVMVFEVQLLDAR